MAALTANSLEAATTYAPGETTSLTLAQRLSAFYHTIVDGKTSHEGVVAESSLADLNDETLIDLGFDPASVRTGYIAADPMARLYF